MHKLILSAKTIMTISCVASFLWVCYSISFEKNAQEWRGVPTFSKWTERAGIVCIEVTCDNKTGYIKDPTLAIAYLSDPSQPLPESILYKDGHVEAVKKK